MTWRERLIAHPLPDAVAVAVLVVVFAVSGALFVRAQTGDFTMPIPCQQKGITDPIACKAYMESLSVPEACRLKGIFDPEQCKRYLESLQAPATEPLTAPSLPEACLRAGITSPEGCKAYMEKLSGATAEPAPAPTFQLPDACLKAGITSPEGCKAYMEKLSVQPPPSTTTIAPTTDAATCTSKCASVKEACYTDAGGVAAEMDRCSVAAGACYQACGATSPTADACLKERCHAVTKDCMATTGDSAEALAACEKVIARCAAACVKGEGQVLTAAECVKYACALVEGRCNAGDAGSFSQESIAAAGGRIQRCVQAGNDCRIRCSGGQVGTGTMTTAGMPEPCRLKGLTDPDACRRLMESLFKGSFGEAGTGIGSAPDFDQAFDAKSFLPPPCFEKGLTDPRDCAELMNQSFTVQLPKECQEAKITEPDECQALFTGRALLPECREKGAKTQEECKAIVVARNLPPDCVEAKAFDEESCRKLVQDAYLPKTCREAGVTDERACEKAVFDKYGRPDECEGRSDVDCRRLIEAGKVKSDFLEKVEAGELPEKCLAQGAKTFEDCDKLTRERTMPAECREAGIFSPGGCEKHLFEKYKKQGEDQFRTVMPAECREAGVEEPEDCRKLMEAKFFPKECVEAGVTDPDGCKAYIQAKYMPEECKAEGIDTRDACEAFLRKKHLDPVCEAQGLTDPKACEEFAYARLAEAVKCQGLEEAECALAIKGRHLGGILDAKGRLDRIKERVAGSKDAAGTIDFDPAKGGSGELLEVLPFEALARRRFAVLDSEAHVSLTDGDELETSSPVVLAFDTDGDGITDDIEERYGLDPTTPNDQEDVQGDLAPVEEAILAGATFGQPVLEGEFDEDLTIVLGLATVGDDAQIVPGDYTGDNLQAGDAADFSAANEELKFTGAGEPGEVVTIYVYSELPFLVTTTVDADGRWSYTVEDQLKDGTHRTYVAVNDATGKVVRKSSPLSFFISEARAATAEEFVAEKPLTPDVNVEAVSEAGGSIRWYLLGGATLLLVASAAAWLVMRDRKGVPPVK